MRWKVVWFDLSGKNHVESYADEEQALARIAVLRGQGLSATIARMR